MKKIFLITFTALILAAGASAQTSWLDRPLNNWNRATGVIPTAPRAIGSLPTSAECRTTVRNPDTLADRALTRAGWSLFGASQVYGNVTVMMAMSSVDGMCRPNQYNGFVFVNNRFAGTLSPVNADARTDGALGMIRLNNATELSAEFARYASSDALCCPSQTSNVNYRISAGPAATVSVVDVQTSEACQTGQVTTQDNVVSGTVTYRQRMALPRTATLLITIADVSRQDTTGVTIAEQVVDIDGKQVPFSFDIAYDRSRINDRSQYAVRAEIRDGGRLLFVTNTSYPVITQGNPRNVDITVVPVGGGGGGGGVGPGAGNATIRGTISYLQRIAIGPNSEVRLKLVDSADPNGRPVAEASMPTSGRQAPFTFELRYETREINRQRNYELHGEIWTDGVIRFRSAEGERVDLRNSRLENVSLVLQPAVAEQEIVTGRTLNLSGIGAGSIRIGNRNPGIVVRATIATAADGTANVSLSTFGTTTQFRGKLIFDDQNTLRIMVESSGNADASGEFEVRYSGSRLVSIASRELKLDGQDVVVNF